MDGDVLVGLELFDEDGEHLSVYVGGRDVAVEAVYVYNVVGFVADVVDGDGVAHFIVYESFKKCLSWHKVSLFSLLVWPAEGGRLGLLSLKSAIGNRGY